MSRQAHRAVPHGSRAIAPGRRSSRHRAPAARRLASAAATSAAAGTRIVPFEQPGIVLAGGRRPGGPGIGAEMVMVAARRRGRAPRDSSTPSCRSRAPRDRSAPRRRDRRRRDARGRASAPAGMPDQRSSPAARITSSTSSGSVAMTSCLSVVPPARRADGRRTPRCRARRDRSDRRPRSPGDLDMPAYIPRVGKVSDECAERGAVGSRMAK